MPRTVQESVVAKTTRVKKDDRAAPGRRVSRESKFDARTIDALLDDLKSKRIPLDRVTITDELQPGLNCIVRSTGNASFHVQYFNKEGKRPYFLIGYHRPGESDHMTIARARGLAKTIRALADKGVDVEDGFASLRDQVLSDIEERGESWRPGKLAKR